MHSLYVVTQENDGEFKYIGDQASDGKGQGGDEGILKEPAAGSRRKKSGKHKTQTCDWDKKLESVTKERNKLLRQAKPPMRRFNGVYALLQECFMYACHYYCISLHRCKLQ